MSLDIFMVIERARKSTRASAKWNEWDPATLPELEPSTPRAKRKSLSSRVADLVFHWLWMTYVLLIPFHPLLVLGPGVYFSGLSPWILALAWHRFFIILMCLLTL